MIVVTTDLANLSFAQVIRNANISVYKEIGGPSTSYLNLYSGTQPTSTVFYTLDLAGLNALSGLLVQLDITNSAGTPTNRVMTLGISAASLSVGNGDASWFVMYSVDTSLQQALMGTVTDINGTGDIRIPEINIVAGTYYKLNGLQINVPAVF